MTGAGSLLPDRHMQQDFFLCDVFDAIPKDDMATMEHPVFSLSTRPDRRILSYLHNGTEITVTPSVRGLATIHDKDILIFCISQLMAALNAGRAVSRTLHLKAHDLLVATNRETSGDGYKRLREAARNCQPCQRGDPADGPQDGRSAGPDQAARAHRASRPGRCGY